MANFDSIRENISQTVSNVAIVLLLHYVP